MIDFIIHSNNEYLNRNVTGYYHTSYTGYQKQGNPDYLNDLKNTFNNYTDKKLLDAMEELSLVLTKDLDKFSKNLTVCVVPRSKSEATYHHKQLLFKRVTQFIIKKLKFNDGSDYITRHKDTMTTHLSRSLYAGSGDMPYPGITKDTCSISQKIKGKDILLIDDIYTRNVNIDEDAIQALFDNDANSIIFYAVAKA